MNRSTPPSSLERIQAALKRLDALPPLDSPSDVSAELGDIRREINEALDDSGLRASRQTSTAAAAAPPPETTSATGSAPPPGAAPEGGPPLGLKNWGGV